MILLRPRTGCKNKSGFSLIEVLVVLVVLVIGILAIVRLFPAGFIALRNAQNSTFADRLGQATLESLKQDQGSLADAVYMYTDTGYNPNIAPDDLTAYTADPAYNDINKQRYIQNETFAVPAPHVIANVAYPSLATLAFGPISLPTTTLPSGDAALPYLKVNGILWTEIKGDSRFDPSDPNSATDQPHARHITNPAEVLGAAREQFVVDLEAGELAVPPADYAQTFTLTVENNTGPVTVTLSVPANTTATGYQGGWFNTLDAVYDLTGTSTNKLPAGPWISATLYRPFAYKGVLASSGTPVTQFSRDPYEYYLYGDNIAPNANMGMLAFNPLAAGRNGIPPIKAQVSYMALNWHVLHEDHDVPDGGGTVKLILDHLKRVGDVQFDQTAFTGLNAVTDTTKQYDIMMLDRDTGEFYGLSVGKNYAGPAASPGIDVVDNNDALDPTHFQLNYAGGRIGLPASFGGKHLRFYYAGDADWAVALQKSPSTYTHSVTVDTNGNATENIAALTVAGPEPNLYAIGGTRVYFPPCDAGKTVELDGLTYSTGTGSTLVQHQVPVVSAPISEAADGTGYYVDLGPLGAGVISTADLSTVTKIAVSGVRGVSARAVVIWHERNTWRMRATDTLLTRSQ